MIATVAAHLGIETVDVKVQDDTIDVWRWHMLAQEACERPFGAFVFPCVSCFKVEDECKRLRPHMPMGVHPC